MRALSSDNENNLVCFMKLFGIYLYTICVIKRSCQKIIWYYVYSSWPSESHFQIFLITFIEKVLLQLARNCHYSLELFPALAFDELHSRGKWTQRLYRKNGILSEIRFWSTYNMKKQRIWYLIEIPRNHLRTWGSHNINYC